MKKLMTGGMKGGKPGQRAMKSTGMGPMMMCHQLMEKKLAMMQGLMEGLLEASQEKS